MLRGVLQNFAVAGVGGVVIAVELRQVGREEPALRGLASVLEERPDDLARIHGVPGSQIGFRERCAGLGVLLGDFAEALGGLSEAPHSGQGETKDVQGAGIFAGFGEPAECLLVFTDHEQRHTPAANLRGGPSGLLQGDRQLHQELIDLAADALFEQSGAPEFEDVGECGRIILQDPANVELHRSLGNGVVHKTVLSG